MYKMVNINVLSNLQRSLRSGANLTGLEKSEALEIITKLGYVPHDSWKQNSSSLLSLLESVNRYGASQVTLPVLYPVWTRVMDNDLRYVGIRIKDNQFQLIALNPTSVCYSWVSGTLNNSEGLMDGVYYGPIGRSLAIQLQAAAKILSGRTLFSGHLSSLVCGSSVSFVLVIRKNKAGVIESGEEVSNEE